MLHELHHFGITVADLDRSVEFYTTFFELSEESRVDMEGEIISAAVNVPEAVLTTVMLAGTNTILELVKYHEPDGGPNERPNNAAGSAHLCIAVEDIDDLHRRMLAAGVDIQISPQDFGPTKFFFAKDPDGVSLELVQLADNVPRAELVAAAIAARASRA